MAGMGIDIVARVAAMAELRAEFGGKDFAPGTFDCGEMVRTHLERLGHMPPDVRPYKTERGGRLKLKKLGYDSIGAVMDALLEPIPPARMIVGDIGVLQGEDGGEAMVICAGRKLIGFREGYSSIVNLVDCPVQKAWRV